MIPVLVAIAEIAGRQPAALLGLRSEAREESARPLLQLAPSGTLSGSVEDLSLRAIYHPRFLVSTGEADRPFLQLHRGAAEAVWRADSGTWLSLRQNLLYGREDYSWLTQLADNLTPDFSRTPLPRAVLIMESESSASLRQRLDGRLEWGASGGWRVYGGADAYARTLVPITRTGSGSVSGAWAASHDRASLAVTGSYNVVGAAEGIVIEIVGDWQHTFRTGATFRAMSGVSQATGNLQTGIFPNVAVALGIEPVPEQRRWGGSISISATPTVDPQTGTLIPRSIASATGSLLVRRELTFSVLGAVARITNAARDSPIDWQSAASATWSFGRHLAVSAGARAVSRPDDQWSAFVAVSSWRRDVF